MPSIAGDLGGAGSIIGGIGQIWGGLEEAGSYRKEAGMYRQAAQWTKYSTQIKEMAANRQIYQTLGTGRADIGASGLRLSGSAADVMRASAAQGSITRNLIGLQGEIDQQGYLAQATAAEGQANAAEIEGIAGGAGDILKGAGQFFIPGG